jgi:hypothetical protein
MLAIIKLAQKQNFFRYRLTVLLNLYMLDGGLKVAARSRCAGEL